MLKHPFLALSLAVMLVAPVAALACVLSLLHPLAGITIPLLGLITVQMRGADEFVTDFLKRHADRHPG